MNTNRVRKTGFTLIELLAVVAIIGILSGVLIPAVGAVRKQSKIAASKAQLSNYVNAMQLFKAEYKYFPLVSGTADSDEIELISESSDFIQVISGRDPSTGASVSFGGNRRRIGFYSFAASEFWLDIDALSQTKLADRFNNRNIIIVVDTDGDGFVAPSVLAAEIEEEDKRIRTNVTAFVGTDSADASNPTYELWQ